MADLYTSKGHSLISCCQTRGVPVSGNGIVSKGYTTFIL